MKIKTIQDLCKAGFNSHREFFTPSEDKFEIALIGDSCIEGFHQDFYDSTGKKNRKLCANSSV
jgi:hypothetical protein